MVSTSTCLAPRERVAALKLMWVGSLKIVVGALMNLPIFWTMIVMHIVSALIAVSLLTTLAIEGAPTRRDRNEPDVLFAHENQEKE